MTVKSMTKTMTKLANKTLKRKGEFTTTNDRTI